MNVKFNYNPDTRLSVILLLTKVTIFLWYKFARFPSADDRLNTLSDYLSPRQSSSSKRWIFSKCICVVPKCTKSWAFRQFLLPAEFDKRVCHFVLFISERQICSFRYFCSFFTHRISCCCSFKSGHCALFLY